MAAYLATLMAREVRLNSSQPRVHICNTWFYEKLYTHERKYKFTAAQRTLKHVLYDITQCEQILVPIHLRAADHWACAELDTRTAVVTYYDSMGGNGVTPSRERVLGNLQRFMQDLERLKGKPQRDWSGRVAPDAPQQTNTWDCGVFTLMACKWRALELPFSYDQRDMDYFRRRIMADIIDVAGPPPAPRATPRRNATQHQLHTHSVHHRSPRRSMRTPR
jgi:sentrin-specific protease 1